MSAEEMTVPPGEVHLDGRIYYMDGAWSGTVAAGQIVQGTTGEWATSDAGEHVAGSGWAPAAALCVWYETFMERLMRDVERRGTTLSALSGPC